MGELNAKEHGSHQTCFQERAQNICTFCRSHFPLKMRFSRNINVHTPHNIPAKFQIDWISQNIENHAFSRESLIEIIHKILTLNADFSI